VSAPHARDLAANQRGFALLVLMAVIGAGSVGVLLAVQGLGSAFAERPQRTERNLEVVDGAMRTAFRANGSFPAAIDALATAAGLDANADWRIDPFFSPNDFDYRNVSGGKRALSRGPDGRLNTADDVAFVVDAEPLVRARQRGRLRLIRAALLRSQYRLAGTMTPTDVATMRTAMRDHAIAQRAWLTADAATRATLTTTLTTTEATIETMRVTHGMPVLPNRVTGGTGLMSRLGMPDTKAIDGNGRNMLVDTVLGARASGYDRTGGTDDDM
jgi:type II secretory pathway pseudopilin PulG